MALNPYQEIPLYSFDIISAYNGASMDEMDPHIFAVAEDAFRTMSRLKFYALGFIFCLFTVRVDSTVEQKFKFGRI